MIITAHRIEALTSVLAIVCALGSALVPGFEWKMVLCGIGLMAAIGSVRARSKIKLHQGY